MFGIACTPVVDSCQRMAKPIQYCKVKIKIKKKKKEKKGLAALFFNQKKTPRLSKKGIPSKIHANIARNVLKKASWIYHDT